MALCCQWLAHIAGCFSFGCQDSEDNLHSKVARIAGEYGNNGRATGDSLIIFTRYMYGILSVRLLDGE